MALTMDEEQSELLAMEMVSASVLPMVLKAALELHVFDIIAEAGPSARLSPLDIASRLPTQNPDAPRLLDRMLRLLASHSALTCSVLNHDNRVYGLAPASKLFLKDKDGGSLASFFTHRIQDYDIIKSWYHLKDSILEGGGTPFYKAHGMNIVEYVVSDPKRIEVFGSSLSEFNVLLMKKVLDTYEGFEGLQVLVDVGGGNGQILSMIISKYPSIKGINFDQSHVIERAPPRSGVEHVAGDMFISIPKGEAIFMKVFCTSAWSDEQCVKVLKKCYEALPDYGKVILAELVAPASPETNAATKGILQMEMYMTILNGYARERTKEEFVTLAREAGFAGVRVACCAYTFSIIEICKQM